ncbi:MAG: lytic transglycosylase domain-containing protein [Parafilimonas sp.]
MKQFFKQAVIHILTAIFCFKKSAPIFLSTAFLILLSSYSNCQSVLQSIKKDSTGLDKTQKINTALLMADSSKMFSSLLSPASLNNNLNFPVNAEARFFADDYIKKHTTYFNNMKVWGKPYFDLYDRILTSYGIPVQLKYLSVIESSLRSTAVSWAGAVGPWQIMSDAAREHGLRTNYYADDRVDYIKSTNAACQILKELYNTYGDWLLVIAAYNCGSGNVNRAIEKTHSKNFWDIQYYLPLETRNHVKKFIATNYFFEGNGNIPATADNNYVLQNKDAYLELAANAATINIYGKYNSVVIANTLMMDISAFNQLNPDIDNALAKGDVYPLRIPADKVQLFQSKKIDILKQSVELLLDQSNTTPTTAGK